MTARSGAQAMHSTDDGAASPVGSADAIVAVIAHRMRDAAPIRVAAPVADVLDPVKATPVVVPVVVPPSTSWWSGVTGWLGGLLRSKLEPIAESPAGPSKG